MPTDRILYRYHFKVDGAIVQTGLTYDIYRRESELLEENNGEGEIVKVGFRTTRALALEWEAEQVKLGMPVRTLKSLKQQSIAEKMANLPKQEQGAMGKDR